MAKRNTSDSEKKPAAPRRRAKTTALPGPAEISVPVPITEAADAFGPAVATTLPVEVPGFAPSPSASEIANRAYEIYVEEGYGHGRDLEHWLAAERELKSGFVRR